MKTISKFTDRIIFDAEVSEKRILLIPVESLKHTPYNPPERTKESQQLTKLTTSIKKFGQGQPIIISSDRVVVDGNRRLTACVIAGIKKIECIVASDELLEDWYKELNTNTTPIKGRGWLYIARNGGIVGEKEKAQYKELLSLLGTHGIDLLIASKIGLNVLPFSKTVSALGSKFHLADIISKVAKNRLSNRINAEIRSDKTREEKIKAIDNILGLAK